MKITSRAFDEGHPIPEKYTMYGANLIPPLEITDVPIKAKSLALIVDDPDAPKGTFTHWLLFNVDPRTNSIDANTVPTGALQGTNDYGDAGYGGPKPPSGTHRYFFRFFALDQRLDLLTGVGRQELETQIKQHAIAEGSLMGTFTHPGE